MPLAFVWRSDAPASRVTGSGTVSDAVSSLILFNVLEEQKTAKNMRRQTKGRSEETAALTGKPVIGFIGVGAMGSRMATRLIGRGYEVIVRDVNPRAVTRMTKRGARSAASPQAVGHEADIVFASLPRPDVLTEIALAKDGLCHGRRVRCLVDLSTTGSVIEQEVAKQLARHRIPLVDAPVTGGLKGAEDGTLTVMVAGNAKSVRSARPLLDIFGRVVVVGPKAGQGQTLKLINNMLSAIALAGSSEAFVMGVKAGLDPDVMLDVINTGSGRNSATLDKFPRSVLPRTFDFGFPIDGFCKDIQLCLDEAKAMGFPFWMANTAAQLYQYARGQGGGSADFTALIRYIEPWAGVTVKSRKAVTRGR